MLRADEMVPERVRVAFVLMTFEVSDDVGTGGDVMFRYVAAVFDQRGKSELSKLINPTAVVLVVGRMSAAAKMGPWKHRSDGSLHDIVVGDDRPISIESV